MSSEASSKFSKSFVDIKKSVSRMKILANIKPPVVIKLSAETREVFTWKQIRGPLSVTFACLCGLAATQVMWYYDVPKAMKIKTAAVLSTIILIMEMGTSEKMYIKSTFRVIGVMIGICIGIVFALIESTVQKYLGIQSLGNGTDNEWIILLFRVLVLGPSIFIVCILMKLKPTFAYGLNVAAINIPAAMLAKTIWQSLGVFVGVMMAAFLCVASLVIFEKFTTESYQMDTNRVCIHGVLSVFQLALTSDRSNGEKFSKHADQVHKSISAAETAQDTYAQWRRYTCRDVTHDFKALVKPTRPLFYKAYSLYWGNVSAFHADQYRAEWLFCDTAEKYEQLFRAYVDDLVRLIEEIKDDLGLLYSKPNMPQVEKDAIFDRIIVYRLSGRIVPIQEQMKQTYIANRKTCFSSYGQRWNMLDYLRQVGMISMALVEYMIALVKVFQTGESKERFMKTLDDLEIALDTLRKESEVSGASYRSNMPKDDGSLSPSVTIDTRPSNISLPLNTMFSEEVQEGSSGQRESQPLLPRINTNLGL